MNRPERPRVDSTPAEYIKDLCDYIGNLEKYCYELECLLKEQKEINGVAVISIMENGKQKGL